MIGAAPHQMGSFGLRQPFAVAAETEVQVAPPISLPGHFGCAFSSLPSSPAGVHRLDGYPSIGSQKEFLDVGKAFGVFGNV